MQTVRIVSRKLLLGCGTALAALVVSGAACAQQRAFDVPAQDAVRAIPEFARQAGIQIIAPSAQLRGVRTPRLQGDLDTRQALRRLLQGTGLEIATDTGTVITLRRVDLPSSSAQASEPETVSTELDDIVVTGTLLRSSGALASPVIVLDREALDARGRATVADILVDLPQNYAGTSTPLVQGAGTDRTGSNSVFSTAVNLRGLGATSTLTLINGRRLAGSGFRGELADISALPSGAVERLDVLLDGASAIYGTDAVAGVVNVILRRTFDGQESRVRASAARGGAEDLLVSHLAGRTWSGGGAYLSLEYQTLNAFSSLDRDYSASGDLRPYGGSDYRFIYSSPGNILAFNAAAGGYVSQYAIRPGPSGVAQTPGDFVAGDANRLALNVGSDLSPETDRYSAYARLSQALGDRLELSADLRYSRRDYTLLNTPGVGIFSVTSANPHFVSPTGAASHLIGYSFYNDLGSGVSEGRSESLGATLAARYDLAGDWELNAYAAYAEESGELVGRNRPNSRFVAEALGNIPDDPATPFSAARDGYLNLFGSGDANSPAVLEFIRAGYSTGSDHGRASSLNLLAEGPLWTLPGGEVRLAVGAQWRDEWLETGSTSFLSAATPLVFTTPEQGRQIAALFAEASLPLVGDANGRPGLRKLELSLAGRIEHYDDFGETTNPRIGLAWSPVDDLSVRMAWGTSFRAPSLPQLYNAPGASGLFLARAGGSQLLSLLLIGGNPDLEPETAETFSTGFTWQPENGFSLDVNYFDTRFQDRIAQPVAANTTNALIDPSLAAFVTLISPGTNPADLARVQSYSTLPGFPTLYPAATYGAIVDMRWVNTGEVQVSGLDLAARYPIAFGGGRLTLEGTASWVLTYDNQTTPTAVVEDVVGLSGYPGRLRARGGATWARGAIGAGLHWSHAAAGRDRLGLGVGAWNTLDGRVSWSPRKGGLEGLTFALSAQNLLDEDPPFQNGAAGYGFDPAQGNPFGRVIAVQLIQRW